MAFVLVTMIALLVIGQGFQFPRPGGMDWRAGGALLTGALSSLTVELGILRWRVQRISAGRRWLGRSLGWIAFNASIAVLCGVALALLLRSPLLDRARTVVVIGIAVLVELAAVILVPGMLWHRRVIGGPLTRRGLVQSAGWFAFLNVASGLVFVLTGAAWVKGYDELAERRRVTHALPSTRDMPCPDTGAVVVAKFDHALPTDKRKLEQLLWDRFANQPAEHQFSGCTTEHWERRYWLYATALVDRARAEGLESAALESCLEQVHPTGVAYLPVGAYRARQGETDVWIFVIKWEGISEQRPISLGHVRIYVFEIESGRQIAYISCR
jgi:hypothetical protein